MPVKRDRGRPRGSRGTREATTVPIRRSPGRPRSIRGRRGGWQVLPRPTYFCCDLFFLSFSLMLILFNVSWYLWIESCEFSQPMFAIISKWLWGISTVRNQRQAKENQLFVNFFFLTVSFVQLRYFFYVNVATQNLLVFNRLKNVNLSANTMARVGLAYLLMSYYVLTIFVLSIPPPTLSLALSKSMAS